MAEENIKSKKPVSFEYEVEVKFSKKFYDTINWYSSNYEKEIGGFIIGKVEDKVVYCEDIIFPKQHVSSGEVEFKDGAIGLLRKEEGEEKIAKIIGEWHSHNTLGCFWSGTDLNDMIAQFMEDFKLGVFVVSSKSEHLVRVETSQPWGTVLDNLDFSVITDDEVVESEDAVELQSKINELRGELKAFNDKKLEEIKAEMMKVVEDKVEEKVYKKSGKKELSDMFEGYDDKDWDAYEKSFFDVNKNIEYRTYEILSSDKRAFSIKMDSFNPAWADELYRTFGVDIVVAPIDYTLSMEIICNDKIHFKKMKGEIKGLIKLLLEEEDITDYNGNSDRY